MNFNFDNSFGRTLSIAQTSMFRHLSKLMKEADLPITPDQFRVLAHLWISDGVVQTELAQSTNRNRANVTRIVDILEAKGIVERRDDPHDKRVFRIYLTDLGKSLQEETAKCAAKSVEDALKNITDEDRRITLRVLQKIILNLE